MKDATLLLFGVVALLAPMAFFWINSRDRKAAEKKWQRLDEALAACESESHAEEASETSCVSDADRGVIESAKRRGLLTEHRLLRKHAWHTHYSLNDVAKGFRWAGMYPDEEEVYTPHHD